ncbi:MAG TPA: L-threonylcarbamoyladenylate synthase, partial [Dehalococcoidia bacterium]|nr:L-threonylcarbamoyladenylate synthase [Dehalococcoidia bacterium]
GALTLVLPASPAVPPIVTAGDSTVAVRIPDHPVPLALITGTGAPLVGTSANVSGQPSPLTAAGVRSQLAGEVDLVIDEDGCCKGTESTIIDLTGEVPAVLREGSIPLQVIQQVCGTDLINKAG